MDLNPDRHDELATLIAHHFEAGGELREAARWSARGAYWAGHSQPREAMRLWQSVMRLVPDPEEDAEASSLAINSRLMLLDYAWRLGIGRAEEAKLVAEAEEIATQDAATSTRWRCCGPPPESAPAGSAIRTRGWRPRPRRPSSPTKPATSTCGWRSARSRAYPHLILGDFDGFEAVLDEMIELIDGDRTIGAGVLVGSPLAYAYMSKGMALRERARFEEAEELFDQSAADRRGGRRSRDGLLGEEQPCLCSSRVRGDVEEGLELARRGLESTERLGDVFSRTVATSQPRRDPTDGRGRCVGAGDDRDRGRIYIEAMPKAGEMRVLAGSDPRRSADRESGRADEALAIAEAAVERHARVPADCGRCRWPAGAGEGPRRGGHRGRRRGARRGDSDRGCDGMPMSAVTRSEEEREALAAAG